MRLEQRAMTRAAVLPGSRQLLLKLIALLCSAAGVLAASAGDLEYGAFRPTALMPGVLLEYQSCSVSAGAEMHA